MTLLNQEYTLELDRDATGKAPTEIEMIPREGKIVGRDGRNWLNDQPRTIISAFDRDGLKLPIDLEHSTQQKAPQGDPAPAVGWITKLYQNPYGAVWGTVEWTNQGRELIESRAYRYISPVFTYALATMSIVKLVSAGLTNRPNLFLQALNRVEPALPYYPFAVNSIYSPPVPAPHPLSDHEKKICDMMGVDYHAFIETREQELQQARNSETRTVSEEKIARMMGIKPGDLEKVKAQQAKETAARAPLSEDELKICRMLGVEPLEYWATKMTEAGLKPQLPA